MSEKLNTIVGKQNDFATRFMGGGTISIGGTIVTLTPPTGQRVRLTHLSTAAGNVEAGIRVIFGSTIVILGGVNGGNPSRTGNLYYSVGSYQPYAVGDPPMQNWEYFTGDTDEALIIEQQFGVPTLNLIYYGYQFGE